MRIGIGRILIGPVFTRVHSCWHGLWSAHHLDEAVNTPLFFPAQCLIPKYELQVLSGTASAAVTPLLALSPAKTSCDAQRNRCSSQAANGQHWKKQAGAAKPARCCCFLVRIGY